MVALPADVICELCRKYAVKRLWVFGSAATERFDPATSDVDFLVEFDPPTQMSPADQYFGFWEGVKAAVQREVDLVERKALDNPYFIRKVESEKVLIYAG